MMQTREVNHLKLKTLLCYSAELVGIAGLLQVTPFLILCGQAW